MTKRKASEKTVPDIRNALRSEFYQAVVDVLQSARANSYRAVNFIMVEAYWKVGRMIVEEEQQGKQRAAYGTNLLKGLSARLTQDFGKGFDESNLRYIRKFYLTFPIRDALRHESPNTSVPATSEILSAVRRELRWTHYRALMRVEKPEAREWYMNEAADQDWSTRALDRQINSLYYERLLLSRDKAPVVDEMRKQTAPLAPAPEDFIKDPYVLEFLGLQDNPGFREAELETAIIGKLQAFMLELGKGFAFVARQQRISTESKDFFIDLVFYNYILKCFVLIDLLCGQPHKGPYVA
jgi:predicted nuclease of restriction endonuclease-like (RecB) superfamily